MKNKILKFTLLVSIFLLIGKNKVDACTSFAYYSGLDTLYGINFDYPKTNEIFIALNRDLKHIWRVSLDDKTIETFSNFEEYKILELTEQEISEKDLDF